MTKPEDDAATPVEEPTTEAHVEPATVESKTSESMLRRSWRRRKAVEPTIESKAAESAVESKADELTVEAPVESTNADPATKKADSPRIRGTAENEPTQTDAADSGGSDGPDDSDGVDGVDGVDEDASNSDAEGRTIQWSRILAFGVLPGLALLLALTAGFLKYVDNSVRDSNRASIESVQAAKDGTVALLSYKPDTVEKQLGDARTLLTGEFEQSYSDLTTNVVIPGAKQQQISASARVPAAAAVSAELNHAVVLVFVNQTVVVGQGSPSDTASSVRVTLDKVGDKWLISKFDPV